MWIGCATGSSGGHTENFVYYLFINVSMQSISWILEN